MMKIKTPSNGRIKRALEKRAPRIVETGKKTLILQGTKTSEVLNSVLTESYHLKKESALRYTCKNDKVRPFESGGEPSLEFFSLKTDCSIFVFGSHTKKQPNNLVIGRLYDYHIYDLVEVGVENFKSMESFSYDKKIAPVVGSKPFIVVENLNLAGIDRAYICTAVSSNRVFFTNCALRLKKSGTIVPRMELVEVGRSMDLVLKRHHLPNDSLRKEAMKTAIDKPKKKEKNVSQDAIQGKIGKIYIQDQKVGEMKLPNKAKGVKRERREERIRLALHLLPSFCSALLCVSFGLPSLFLLSESINTNRGISNTLYHDMFLGTKICSDAPLICNFFVFSFSVGISPTQCHFKFREWFSSSQATALK